MKYFMNPMTGTVQTEQEWADEGFSTANAALVEVAQDQNGDWVEA